MVMIAIVTIGKRIGIASVGRPFPILFLLLVLALLVRRIAALAALGLLGYSLLNEILLSSHSEDKLLIALYANQDLVL